MVQDKAKLRDIKDHVRTGTLGVGNLSLKAPKI